MDKAGRKLSLKRISEHNEKLRCLLCVLVVYNKYVFKSY